MTEQPVLELLVRQSTAKLRGMQRDIHKKIVDLQVQDQLIDRALAAKGDGREKVSEESSTHRNGNKPTGTNALIRAILAEHPDQIWTPAEIIREVRSRGSTSSDPAIRVALRRMSERPHAPVERGPDGTGWRLASSNGSAGESFSEAPSWGSGEHGRQSSRTDEPDLRASSPGDDAQTRITHGSS